MEEKARQNQVEGVHESCCAGVDDADPASAPALAPAPAVRSRMKGARVHNSQKLDASAGENHCGSGCTGQDVAVQQIARLPWHLRAHRYWVRQHGCPHTAA